MTIETITLSAEDKYKSNILIKGAHARARARERGDREREREKGRETKRKRETHTHKQTHSHTDRERQRQRENIRVICRHLAGEFRGQQFANSLETDTQPG